MLTADANGFLKTWDTRQKKVCVHSFLNESLKKSISHVATYDIGMINFANFFNFISFFFLLDYDTKYVAVNSYANGKKYKKIKLFLIFQLFKYMNEV